MTTSVPYSLLIFDLDGTLADTGADIADAMTRTLRTLDLPAPAPREIVAAVGWGPAVLASKILRPEHRHRAEEVLHAFRDDYCEHLVVRTRLYPGIASLLEDLQGAGVRLGLATNKPGDLTRALVEQLHVARLFGDVVGPEDVPRRKPAPDVIDLLRDRAGVSRSATAMVGDMETDIDAARAAGVDGLLVTWSDFWRGPELEQRAARIARTPDELRSLLLPTEDRAGP